MISVGELARFHTAETLLPLTRPPTGRSAGASPGPGFPRAEVEARYGEGDMRALRVLATRGGNTNVLQHMAGYFKDRLGHAEKAEPTRPSPTTGAASSRRWCRSRCSATTCA